jgi:hypothetical protein
VAQFVDYNTSFKLEVAITVRKVGIPKIHPQAAVLSIRRSHEIRVIESGTILGISNDCVVLGASSTEVILLEIARNFIKSISAISGQYSNKKTESR